MKEFIKSIFSDIDNMGSSKRITALWVVVVLLTFVHIICFVTESFKDERTSLINGDYWLAGGVLGLCFFEKLTNRNPSESKPQS